MNLVNRGVVQTAAAAACIFSLASPSLADHKLGYLKRDTQAGDGAPRSICQKTEEVMVGKTKSVVERLKPGEDFQVALKRIASEHKVKAGVIASAVGSFKTASLRFAGANEATTITGPLEVVSVTGTISDKGMHVHMSVSDSSGRTVGGHLMPGCKVFTTIELVILDLSDEWVFDRKPCEHTSYMELDAHRSDGK